MKPPRPKKKHAQNVLRRTRFRVDGRLFGVGVVCGCFGAGLGFFGKHRFGSWSFWMVLKRCGTTKEPQSPGKNEPQRFGFKLRRLSKTYIACFLSVILISLTTFDLVTWNLPTAFHVLHVCFSMRFMSVYKTKKRTDATCQGACWKRGWGCKGLQMSCRLASLLPDEPTIRWTQLSDALLRIVWVLQLLVPYEIRIEMNYIKSNNILYLQNTRTYIYIYTGFFSTSFIIEIIPSDHQWNLSCLYRIQKSQRALVNYVQIIFGDF